MKGIPITKSTIVATSALLLASVAGIHTAAAAQESAVDGHVQARTLLQRAEVTPGIPVVTLFATHSSETDALDAHEQARSLVAGSPLYSGDISTTGSTLASLEITTADAHGTAERLLQKVFYD
jgi:hypothetical protein